MSALFTTKTRCLNALNFKNEENLYLAIGRTTPWDDENNPPTPSVSDIQVTELIYIKKITVKHLAILDTPYDAYGIDVSVGGYDYNYVADEDAYSLAIPKVYLSTSIFFSDIAPTNTSFRQIGILLNPQDVYGSNLTGIEYLAASVGDQGELLYLENREVITRDPSQSEKFEFILIF